MNKLLSVIFSIYLLIPCTAQGKRLKIDNLPAQIQKQITDKNPQILKKDLNLKELEEILRILSFNSSIENISIVTTNSQYYEVTYSYSRRIKKINFSGNNHFSTSSLLKQITLESNSSYGSEEVQSAYQQIIKLYKEDGYLNTTIDIETQEQQNEVNLFFKINEGEPCKIKTITFYSENGSLNSELLNETKGSIGNLINDLNIAKINSDIKDYLKSQSYVRTIIQPANIKINNLKTEAHLTYRLDNPESYTFKISGNKYFQDSDILRGIDIKEFYTSNPNIGPELISKIKQYYLSRGYARVSVQYSEQQLNSYLKQAEIQITEGEQIKIEAIEFVGRFSQPKKKYSQFILQNSSKLIKDRLYNKDHLDTGIKNLIAYLRNEGFLQAKVISSKASYNDKKDSVVITINLDEGPQTILTSIDFEGATSIDKLELLEQIDIKSNSPLRLEKLDSSLSQLKNYYRENGFIEFRILNEHSDLVKYNSDFTQANVTFKVIEGPKVVLTSILIEGNDFTKDYVILNELDLPINEILTPTKLEDAIFRLQSTGYFSSVEARTLEENTNISQRTLLVRVKERAPGLVTLGIGVTNERQLTLRGHLGISYNNLFGTGRGVSARGEGNYNIPEIKYLESKIILSYLEPYLLQSRYKARVNLIRSQAVTDFDIGQVTEATQAILTAEKELTRHISFSYEVFNFARLKDFGIDNRFNYDEKVQDIFSTGPTINFDYRDNPIFPTKGSHANFSLEYADPQYSSKTIHYYKATSTATNYLRIGELADSPVIWANQLRLGYLKNLSNDVNGGVPYDKKGFILGGKSTIRGFELGTNDVFPNRTDLGEVGSDKFILTTNATTYLIKSEFRIPIYDNIFGTAFYDGGSVEIQGLNFPDHYRDAAGVGLQYNTPFGPFNLEIAWKLDRRPSEEPYRIHLSVGSF